MATLGNIRKHGVLLLVVVGVAMLAFIVGDFLSSSNSYFSRKRENVGVIEGHKVHYTDYEAAKEQLTEVYKIEYGRSDFDEDMYASICNQVWQNFVSEYTLQAQAEKIGMDVTKNELADLCFGNNVHQLLRGRRAFCDANGNFNRNYLVQFINSIEQETEDSQDQASLQQAKTYWLFWEKTVRLSYLQEKYMGLFNACVTANKLDAKYAYDARQKSVDVEYFCQPYYEVSDSLVTVKDADIKALYNKQKPLLKQKPNRSIAYVSFDIVPSEEDIKATIDQLTSIKQEFDTTNDVMTVVNLNSDVMYDGRNYSASTIPAEYKDFAFGAGAHAGRVTDIKCDSATLTYSMARLVEAGYNRPDSVKLQAVVKGADGNDSIITLDQEWYTEMELPADLAEKAFTAKANEIITTSIGLNEQRFKIAAVSAATPKVKLAVITRTVSASSKTRAALYNEAKQFIVNNNTQEKFETAAKEAGMAILPATLEVNSDKVAQLKASRPIVRWAFEAKDGQVSDVHECGEQLIVAVLTDINEGEYRSMESVSAQLRAMAINDKKAELMIADLKGLNFNEAMAKAGVDSARVAEGLTLSSYALGNEPAVVGAALKLENGATSAPIKGNQGVFVLRANNKQTAEGEFNEASEIAQLNQRNAYYIQGQPLNLIQDKAEIEDNRANFQ